MVAIQRKSGAGRCALAAVAFLAAACTGGDEGLQIGLGEGFAGAVAADEPRAALIGRDILIDGGTAADAAVAMYFAMAVTLPSRAGLAGGGTCLIFDQRRKGALVLEFLPKSGALGGVVPRGPRAMAALHARHGKNRWEMLVSPAESLARLGHPTSRAFARDLARGAAIIRADPALSRMFRTRSGALLREGDVFTQVELAALLAGIRSHGAGYLYSGRVAEQLVQASNTAGQPMTAADLRDSVPGLAPAAQVDFAWRKLYFSVPPAADGLLAAQLWQMLNEVADYEDSDEEERPHLFAEAAMRVFGDRARWLTATGASRSEPPDLLDDGHLERLLEGYDRSRHTPAAELSPQPRPRPENTDGTSFVAGDRWGNAVACSLTMNGLFGAGRMATGSGLVLAATPSGDADGTLSPSLAILGDKGDAHLAIAASGGAAAPTAMVKVLLEALVDGRPLTEAVAAPRLHHGGSPDAVLFEPTTAQAVLGALRSRGHELRRSEALGRVNLFYCSGGLTAAEQGCAVASDPRGWGLGTLVQ